MILEVFEYYDFYEICLYFFIWRNIIKLDRSFEVEWIDELGENVVFCVVLSLLEN